jgi:hypothetical protein
MITSKFLEIDKSQPMKFAADRPYADPAAA